MVATEDEVRRRISSTPNPLSLLRAAADETRWPALVWLRSADDPAPVELTYGELLAKVEGAIGVLQARGVEPGGTVGILGPPTPDSIAALIAATAIGIAFPINAMLTANAMATQLALAQTRAVVAFAGAPLPDILPRVAEASEQVPSITSLISFSLDPGDSPFDSALYSSVSFNPLAPDEERLAALFHTGGTSGDPKLAQLSALNLAAGAHMAAAAIDYRAGDRVLVALPLFHVGGAIDAVLAGLAARATVILPPPLGARDPAFMASIWRICETQAVNLVMMVPTSLSVIADQPVAGADLAALRGFITGASPLPTPVAAKLQTMTGKPVSQLFGMTEASGICTSQPCDGVFRSHAVGYPAPLLRLRLSGEDGLGEVQYSGPNVFKGYRTVNGTVGEPADGWVASGDLSVLESDGQLRLIGRSKDVIIRGGHNIDPQLIEEAALAHPDVAMAAAVAMPDSYAGELPVLYVTFRQGRGPEPQAIADFVRERISDPPARPKSVFVLDALPLTAVGKIARYKLRQAATEFRASQSLEGLAIESIRCSDPAAKNLEIGWSPGACPSQREDALRRLADLGLTLEA